MTVSTEVNVRSELFVIEDFREVRKHLVIDDKTKKKFALLDFDDTMAKSGHAKASHLGGLAWRDDFRKCIQDLKSCRALKEDTHIFDYVTLFIAKSVNVEAVQDPEIADTIKQLELDGFNVRIFTARGRNGENAWYGLNISGIDEFTLQQMHKAGIRITSTTLPEHIFAQNVKKNIIIGQLFAEKVIDPKEVSILAFADDKKEQAEVVKKECEGKVPFVGFHYTAVQEAEKGEYDLLKATIQLVNLFAQGKFLEKEAMDAKAAEFKATRHLTPKEYFNVVILKLEQFFEKYELNRPYKDHEEFFATVRAVADKHFLV